MHRSPSILEHGRLFSRYLHAMRRGNGDLLTAAGFAEATPWHEKNVIAAAIKSSITASSAASAAALMLPIGQDYSAFMMPLSALGRLQGLHRVPLSCRLFTGTAPATAYWVGDGAPTPLSNMNFDGEILKPLALNALAVTTDELLKMSGLVAETEFAAVLAAAGVRALDTAFLNPANSGVPDVMPASVTSGITPLVSSGSTVAAIDADLLLMVQTLAERGSNLEWCSWIMSARTATALALKRGSGGSPAYPTISSKGGALCGMPVIVTDNVPSSGSPASSSLILCDAAQVRFADAGDSDLELSTNAALEMDNAPTNNSATATGTSVVSMYQAGAVAIRVTRYCNWSTPSGAAAIALTGVNY
jgi:hypothetical protein